MAGLAYFPVHWLLVPVASFQFRSSNSHSYRYSHVVGASEGQGADSWLVDVEDEPIAIMYKTMQ